MFSRVRVLDGGLATTLQDLGRPRSRRFGVPPGGALDQAAHRAANQLVQNSPQAASLEIILRGPHLRFETSALIAIAGPSAAGAELSDGQEITNGVAVFVQAGQELSSRGANRLGKFGRCAYLAIHGGFEAPLVMESRSTYLRAKLGGYLGEGRKLAKGDLLESGEWTLPYLSQETGRVWLPEQRPPYSEHVHLRLIVGPYQDNFRADALPTLLSATYKVSPDSDRMGFRLEGEALRHLRPELAEIDSCATVAGAIQVPSNGQPIILMADHQVTGGYPIIAAAVSEDLPLLAQLLPGGKVSFNL